MNARLAYALTAVLVVHVSAHAAVPPRAAEPVKIILPDFAADLRAFDAPVAEPVEWVKHMVNAGWGEGRGGPERKGGWIDKHSALVDYTDRSADYVSHEWLRHRGIWHEVYGSNEYQETIHFHEKGARELFWDNGIARDMLGERTLSAHYNTSHEWWKKRVGWDAFIVCNNAPRWSAVINYDLLTSPLFGDSMSQDNIGGPTSRIGSGSHGRYCDHCNRKFFHYLAITGRLPGFRKKYTHIRDYVQANLMGLFSTLPPNKTKDRFRPSEAVRIRQLCDDPVMAEYIKFLHISHMHNMLRYYRDQKAVAKRLGKPYDVHGNMGGGFMGGNAYQIALADFCDTIWFESAGTSTYDMFKHKWHNAWGSFRFEIGRAMLRGKKALMCMSKFHKKEPDIVAHELAEQCAGGGVLFVAQHAFAKRPDLLDVMQGFFELRHNHRAIFGQHRMSRHCDVAMVYSVPTMMYRNYMAAVSAPPACAMIGMARGLEDNHVPFDVVILNHPEIHDDFVTAEELKRYKLLILPVLECLSDGQIEKIGQHLDAGGTVGVIGEVGTRDENNQPRDESVIDAWKARGRVVDLTPTPGFLPPRGGDAKTSKQATNDAARRVRAALGARIISGDLPSTLWVKTWAHDCGVASLHFVNYDVDFESAKATPTQPARVSVVMPDGVPTEEGQFLAPGQEPVRLEILKADGRVEFELPSVRVYGVVLIGKAGLDRDASAAALGDALFARAAYACASNWGELAAEAEQTQAMKANPQDYASAAEALLARAAGGSETGYVSRVSRMADAADAVTALDFAGETPKAPWQTVAADTTYSADRGFGWTEDGDTSKPTPEEIHYSMASRYHRDMPYSIQKGARLMFWPYRQQPPAPVHYALCCGGPRRFRIDLERGLYAVNVVRNMPSWTQRNFLVSGMVTANGAPALLDAAMFKGELADGAFTVDVTGGKLDLTFGGPTGWAVSTIVVRRADKPKADPLAAGAIRAWKVSPRYANKDWYPIYQTTAAPERDPASPDTSGWLAVRAADRGIGLVDLGSNTQADTGDVVYALATIDSPGAQEAVLHLGASSQAMAWLNRERVAYLPNVKGVQRDEHAARVQLKPGRNVLLLKLSRFWERRWMFYASVTNK